MHFLIMSSHVPLRALYFYALQARNRCCNRSRVRHCLLEVTEVIQKNFKVEVKLVMKKQKREVTRTNSQEFCE